MDTAQSRQPPFSHSQHAAVPKKAPAPQPQEPQPKYEFEKHQIGRIDSTESHTSSFNITDMDGDGDQDIVVFGYSGKLYIFENKGKNVNAKTTPSPLEHKVEAEQR